MVLNRRDRSQRNGRDPAERLAARSLCEHPDGSGGNGVNNAISMDDCLLKFCEPIVSAEDMLGKEFFEASVPQAVREHLHFTIFPLVPRVVRCGWHLVHDGKDTVFPASTSSHSTSYRAAGISHYGWTVCRRCGRVACLQIRSSLWRSEDLVGFLNMSDPIAAFDEIMTHFTGGKTK